MKRHLKFQFLYASVFFLQLLADYQQLIRLKQTTRPLITILLLLVLYFSTRLSGKFHKRIFAGLLFSLAGDIFLLQPGYTSLVYGFSAFLICHLCYISAFYLDFKSAPELDKRGARIAILICGVLCTGFYFYLRPHLGAMRLPVLGYSLVMTMMVMMAAFRNQRVNRKSFGFVLAGAICFAVSAALLAIHQFSGPFPEAGLFITGSYIAAQYLITMGAITRKLLNKP